MSVHDWFAAVGSLCAVVGLFSTLNVFVIRAIIQMELAKAPFVTEKVCDVFRGNMESKLEEHSQQIGHLDTRVSRLEGHRLLDLG